MIKKAIGIGDQTGLHGDHDGQINIVHQKINRKTKVKTYHKASICYGIHMQPIGPGELIMHIICPHFRSGESRFKVYDSICVEPGKPIRVIWIGLSSHVGEIRLPKYQAVNKNTGYTAAFLAGCAEDHGRFGVTYRETKEAIVDKQRWAIHTYMLKKIN